MSKSRFLEHDLSHYASKSTIPAEMVGCISDDRSAVAGRCGWCFIYEGSNDYRFGYFDENLRTVGNRWAHIIEGRQRACDKLGVQFLQLVVPNKLTVLPEYFPETLRSDISFPLKGLIGSNPNANLLIPIDEFRGLMVREAIFRRNDSHLTVAGNAYLTDLILDNLGVEYFDTDPVETEVVRHVGDLGVKFTQAITEELHAPLWSTGFLDQQKITKIKDVLSVALNGVEQVFENPTALVKKKILVIGNSFFERVPSWGLSPFFSSLFSAYHFVWSPNFDQNAIEKESPDFVLAQTCERFLTKLPVDVVQ